MNLFETFWNTIIFDLGIYDQIVALRAVCRVFDYWLCTAAYIATNVLAITLCIIALKYVRKQ